MRKEELFNISIEAASEEIYRKVKDNWNHVAKPLDGLGVMESLLCSIGSIQRCEEPKLSPRALVIMCADNGIVEEGVSQSGQEVTLAVAYNMGRHESSVCKMCKSAGVDVIPVDIGINSDEEIPGVISRKVAHGTRNFHKEPAMTEEELLQAIDTGINMVKSCKDKGYVMLATGEMGIGNTTTSTAVAASLLSISPSEVTGRGAGLDDAGLSRKTRVITESIEKYGFGKAGAAVNQEVTFEILRSLGGLDIAGLCGVFIGGAIYHIPVVIDGVISAAAALCAERLVPGCREYMLASHRGEEPAMKYILEELKLTEVIHARLALGEGTGAVMLFPLLDMAETVYRESSSFDQIGVEQYTRY